MKVLLDTNVVLDAIVNREPFCLDAQNIINLILDDKLEGYITAIDFIITRDEEFLQKVKPSIPVILPADFLQM